MTKPERIRRQQLLRQAEGYLELTMSGAAECQLATELRGRLVERGLHCLEGLEDSPSLKSRVYHLRGQLLREMGRFEEAVSWLQKATDMDSQNLDVYLGLGWCYKRLGRLDLAIESLERALELDDPSGIIQYNLACYWALAGHVKLALDHLARAFETEPALRDLVHSESDFDPIRTHPDFLAFTTVNV